MNKFSQSLEAIMPVIYNKLKSLGELNGVVPIQDVIKGLQSGSARAYVSNQDKNEDGVPDKINIVYPTIDIDLNQSLNGITSADITAFPNIDAQKAYHVLNILAASLEILRHEQDHLDGFRSVDGVDEFGSESSAHQAGESASSNFINKWKKTIDSTINKGSSRVNSLFYLKGNNMMKKELVKLANHLDRIGHRDLSDRIDNILKDSFKKVAAQDPCSATPSKGDFSSIMQCTHRLPAATKLYFDVMDSSGGMMTPWNDRNVGRWYGYPVGHESNHFEFNQAWYEKNKDNFKINKGISEITKKDLEENYRLSGSLNDNSLQEAFAEVARLDRANRSGSVASGPVSSASADDGLASSASNDLSNIFSVNPIGKVSR